MFSLLLPEPWVLLCASLFLVPERPKGIAAKPTIPDQPVASTGQPTAFTRQPLVVTDHPLVIYSPVVSVGDPRSIPKRLFDQVQLQIGYTPNFVCVA